MDQRLLIAPRQGRLKITNSRAVVPGLHFVLGNAVGVLAHIWIRRIAPPTLRNIDLARPTLYDILIAGLGSRRLWGLSIGFGHLGTRQLFRGDFDSERVRGSWTGRGPTVRAGRWEDWTPVAVRRARRRLRCGGLRLSRCRLFHHGLRCSRRLHALLLRDLKASSTVIG